MKNKPSMALIFRHVFAVISIALTVLASGCATRQPPAPERLSGHEFQVFMARSKYPEMLTFELIERADGVFARKANEIKSARRAILDFESPRKSKLPVVEVETQGGKHVKMLLDTSSRKSWMSYAVSEDFDVVPVGPEPYRYTANHLRDSIPGILASAPYLRMNKTIMTSALFYVRADKATLWPVSRTYRKPKIDLVMGCGMMKAFSFIRIDYSSRIVSFVADETYPSPNDRTIASVPIVWENGAIAVNAAIDGEDQLLYIDTGGDYELARPDGSTAACGHIFIDDLVVANLSVCDAKEHRIEGREFPSIGSQLLSRFVLVIDMSRQQLHFEKP